MLYVVLALAVVSARAEDFAVHTWEKVVLTEQFFAEGANYGDFNKDGKMDVVYGPYWYEGPDFKVKHEIYSFKPLADKNAYSNNFLTYVYDFNGDGFPDVLVYGFPGAEAGWYENPKGKDAPWVRHPVIKVLDNESPNFGDITGDGKPEIICNSGGQLGYAEADWTDPTKMWTWHPVSLPDKRWHKYTHGLGYGDINGDGRVDLVEATGWWEQPADPKQFPWTFHPYNFVQSTWPIGIKGGAQMIVYDFNGDGLADVFTSLSAHEYGIAYYEQYKEGNEIKFKQHLIVTNKAEDNPYGVRFSQAHAFDLIDIDGDGVKDIVTGKRHYAHGAKGDPEPQAAPVLYWFRTVRSQGKVDFVPYLIDNDSGVGTQICAGDVNGDGLPDVIVGNKRGGFVMIHKAQKVSKEEWEKAQPKLIAPATK